jgi:hypothetical protein
VNRASGKEAEELARCGRTFGLKGEKSNTSETIATGETG